MTSNEPSRVGPAVARRGFLSTTAAITAGSMLVGRAGQGRAAEPEHPRDVPLPSELAGPDADQPWLRKTLKNGMIRVEGPSSNEWLDKFNAAKQAGFAGVEIQTAAGIDTEQAVAAARQTGLVIDGTVGGYHWQTTHTHPDESVRRKAQSLLQDSLTQTAALGAETFLIVPGHGKDGTPEEVRQRAHDAIAGAIPLAQRLGVNILIENVWNHFLYDHDGDANQSAQPLADFVDSFGTTVVGVQFDLGNHWKYGDVAQWVRTLGSRIQKLDIKGFSRQQDKFTDITEGDIDWGSVRTALAEIRFTGWVAAEVGGGDVQRLTMIAKQMDDALHCDASLESIRKARA